MDCRVVERLPWLFAILFVSYDVIAAHYIPSYCGEHNTARNLLQDGQIVASLGSVAAASIGLALSRKKRVILGIGFLGLASFLLMLPLVVFGGSACGEGPWIEDIIVFTAFFGGMALAAGSFFGLISRAIRHGVAEVRWRAGGCGG